MQAPPIISAAERVLPRMIAAETVAKTISESMINEVTWVGSREPPNCRLKLANPNATATSGTASHAHASAARGERMAPPGSTP